MGRKLEKLTKGLLEGFGTGMEKVGNSIIEREKAAAAELRAQNLARFQHGLNMEGQKQQQEFTAAQGLLTSERNQNNALELEDFRSQNNADAAATTASQVARVIDSVDEQGNPIQIPVDANNTPVGKQYKRPISAAEAAALKATAEGGKYDNPLHDDAMKILNERFGADAINEIKAQGDTSITMDSFMTENTLTGKMELDPSRLRASYPKLADKYDMLKIMVEDDVRTTKSPELSVKKMTDKLNAMSQAQVQQAYTQRLGEIMDASGGLPISAVQKLITDTSSPQFAQNFVAKYDEKDPNDKKALAAIKNFNPTLHDQLVMEVKKKKPETASPAKTLDKVPEGGAKSREDLKKYGFLATGGAAVYDHVGDSLKNSPGLF